MRRTRRTGVLALAASLALTGGVVTVVLPAAAGTTTQFIDGGTLTLTTGSTNTVAYTGSAYAGAGQTLTTTTITTTGAANCDLANPLDGPLLAFKGYLDTQPATPLTVGFKGGSLGVNEEIDSLCSRVDAISKTGKTEYLDVALSDKLVNYGGNRLLGKSALLDIEVKQSGLFNTTKAKIEAIALRGGVAQGTFNLVQGAAPSSPAVNTFYCNVGDTKNCQWKIELPADTYFDTLRLKAVSAGFSLEGGSDSGSEAGAKPTTFNLVSEVDQVVQCVPGTAVSVGTTTVTYQGGGTCTEVGIVVKNQDEEVTFLKPSNDPNAKFVLDVKWTIPVPTGTDPIPNTTVNFVATDHPIGWCAGAVIDTNGNLTGATVGADLEPDALTGTQYACVGKQSANIVNGKLEVNEQIFLVGDVALRK